MTALTLPQLARQLPPARTRSGRGGLSKRYAHINTLDVARELYSQGFQAVQADFVKTKKKVDQPYARHLIRFQHQEDTLGVGAVPQILIYNSHDGESAFRGLSGFFRFVCSNGLISGTIQDSVRFVHGGEVSADQVARELVDLVEPTIGDMVDFQDAPAPVDLRVEFGRVVAREAFPEALAKAPDKLDDIAFQLLRPRRWADMEGSAWTALNVAQENLIRGGVEIGSGTSRRQVTRAVRGVERDVEWNQMVWDAAADVFLGRSVPPGRVVTL